ncbi:hypothetical protein Zmor_026823 [Zophobas morio]|uniref:Uncharacterized protein n=1 Tax=Zophobas morio TaxID=2755281 RepID=A0AA38M5I0_9CUCU|nr:hypothetical protein Zmor_026823 [Zophobas morio]
MLTDDKDKTINLWVEAINSFTPELWRNSIKYCEQLICDGWRKDMGSFGVQHIPPIIINLAKDADDSDSDFLISSDDESYLEIIVVFSIGTSRSHF